MVWMVAYFIAAPRQFRSAVAQQKAIILMSQLRQVGDYEILKKIGSGAFSQVFLARHAQSGQEYALKEISRNLTQKNLAYISSQIDILEQIRHESIIGFYGSFRQQGTRYLVFEYCSRGDLQRFVSKHKTLQEATVQMIAWCICSALNQLTMKNIAHRDLKLANVLITEDYKVKLADFGFSKQTELSMMTTFCGTPITMAPEIFDGKNYRKENCDTWSLGIIVYQMLFGDAPWTPKENSGMQGLSEAIKEKELRFNQEIIVTEECRDFISRCLDKNSWTRATITEILKHPWLRQGEKLLRQTKNMFEKELIDAPNIFKHCVKQQVGRILEKYSLSQPKQLKSKADRLLKECKLPQMMGEIIRERLQRLAQSQIIFKMCDSTCKVKLGECHYYQQQEDQWQRDFKRAEKKSKSLKFRRAVLRQTIAAFLQVLQKEKNADLVRQKMQFLQLLLSKLLTNTIPRITIKVEPSINLSEEEESRYKKYLSRALKLDRLIEVINDPERQDTNEKLQSSYDVDQDETEITVDEPSTSSETGDINMLRIMLEANLRSHNWQPN